MDKPKNRPRKTSPENLKRMREERERERRAGIRREEPKTIYVSDGMWVSSREWFEMTGEWVRDDY